MKKKSDDLEALKKEVAEKEAKIKPMLEKYFAEHYPDMEFEDAFEKFFTEEFAPYAFEESLKDLSRELEKERKAREREKRKGTKIIDVIE